MRLYTRLTEILLIRCLIFLALIFLAQMISLIKILDVQCSEPHPLANSIAITFLFMYCVNSACDCSAVVVGLLVISWIYVLVQLLLVAFM